MTRFPVYFVFLSLGDLKDGSSFNIDVIPLVQPKDHGKPNKILKTIENNIFLGII